MLYQNPAEWAPIADGDSLTFDGLEPTVLTLRALGGAALYLVGADGAPDLLLGVGHSSEFTVSVKVPGEHSLRVVLEATDLYAAYKTRQARHSQPDQVEHEPFVVIKPRVQQSEEMRTMMRLLHQQEQSFARRLSEIHSADPRNLVRSDVVADARSIHAVVEDDGDAPAPTAPGDGIPAPGTGGGKPAKPHG